MSRRAKRRRDERIRQVFATTGKIGETARRLGHSVNTVRKVLRGQSGPRKPPATVKPRPSKLDPFKPVIQRLMIEDQLTAVLVLEEIRALGYGGGYSILKDYIKRIKPQPHRRPTAPIDHPPGAEAQVDWSPYRVFLGGLETVVHGFSLVLPFSRFMVLRFALDEQLETLVALHEEALALVGGVPQKVSYDNMTTVGRHVGPNDVWLNPRFDAYARHVDFGIHLIDPGQPNQHGSVERPFHYVENNCLKRRRSRFADFGELNRYARWWCDEVANVRIHGTTRQRPVDLLQRERLYLKPLACAREETFRLFQRDVGRDFCVRLDNCRYSVHPDHIGKAAEVRAYRERLEIFIEGHLAAVHTFAEKPYQRIVLPEHEEAFKRATPSRLLLEQAFLRLGEAAGGYYEGLKASRGRGAGYHLQRILKLADRYGSAVVCGAMAHAARYGNYSADSVARVIGGRALLQGERQHSVGSASPQNTQQWLSGLDVERTDLADFDALVDRMTSPGEDDEDGRK